MLSAEPEVEEGAPLRETVRRCRELDARGQTKDAVRLLDQCIAVTPAARLYFERGLRREDLGLYEAARRDYTSAVELDPAGRYWTTRGLLLWSRLAQPEAALLDFQEARRRSPNDADPLSMSALCYLDMGKLTEALADARAAVTLAPGDASAQYSLALCLLAAKSPHDAAQALDIAVSLEPETPHYWASRSRALRNMGDYREAKNCIERAIDLDPKPGYLVNHASLLLELDRPGEALEILQKVRPRLDTEALNVLAEAYARRARRMVADR